MTHGEEKRRAKGGRPRCAASGNSVRELRETGFSWRQVARTLGIGTATAIRLSRENTVPKPSQNPGGAN